jgi:Kef-type K+ transport system membrane component KefB
MDFLTFLSERLLSNFILLTKSPVFDVLFILVVAWTVGVIFKLLKLPLIAGQLLAGLIMGPPILNIIKFTPTIEVLAQLGAFFIMLYLGVKTDPRKILRRTKAAVSIALAGFFVPFILGYLIVRFFGGGTYQALFIGMAISTTSLATKATILDELKLLNSKAGNAMVGAGVIENTMALVLFSVILNAAKTNNLSIWSLLATVIEVILFFAIVLFVGVKLYPYLKRYLSDKKDKGFTFTLIVALCIGALAELIGLHFILGAYLAGLFVREEILAKELFNKINDRLMVLSYGLLAPMFFISIAFNVTFDFLREDLLLFILILIAAFAGKTFASGFYASRNGFSERDSWLIGFGMNGRGTIELIIASVGISLGIINQSVVSILVFVAFITTLATPISLHFVLKRFNHKKLNGK